MPPFGETTYSRFIRRPKSPSRVQSFTNGLEKSPIQIENSSTFIRQAFVATPYSRFIISPNSSLASTESSCAILAFYKSDKIKADKKLVVATNMELTETEAKGFWPIYDEYQKDLQKINRRIANLLDSYAADFRSKTLTDDKAKKLIDEAIAIEQAEADLKSTYAPKLSKVLPVKKVARYLQIENKIRAVVKYDLAQGVPLVK